MKMFRWFGVAQVLTWEELAPVERQMIERAVVTREHAQAPYSKDFRVGAAVQTELGGIYAGMNVENANWTLTSHAEKCAIVAAITDECAGIKIARIAVVAGPSTQRITLPPLLDPDVTPEEVFAEASALCGGCRQDVWENAHDDPSVGVLLLHASGYIIRTTIGSIFPMPFGPKQLGVSYSP